MQGVLNQAVVGGLYEPLYGYIVDGQAKRSPELMPDLIYCALPHGLTAQKRVATADHSRSSVTSSPLAVS